MATLDVSKLEQIFRMLTPSDVLGNQKTNLGAQPDLDGDPVSVMKRMLYNAGAGGAMSVSDMKKTLAGLMSKVQDEEALKLFRRVFSLYSSDGPMNFEGAGKAQYMYKDPRDGSSKQDVSFDQIIRGGTTFTMPADRTMSVFMCNSDFLAPAARNVAPSELFFNFIPTLVMSRCVPYVEIEFVYDRPDTAPLRSAGLLKFLLGSPAKNTTAYDDVTNASTATGQMANLLNVTDPVTEKNFTTSNMELFTSPQTLVNMSPDGAGSRYTQVLDPTRPFASLQTLVVNVRPTVGLFSFKTAHLTFKLHDRSRLAEIGDLIRPQIYTNTTVWVTYGWRHPDEPENPYAEFINNNMLIREAYGVQNSSFAFDAVGQVGVDLELYTKGVTELRTMRIPDTNPSGLKALQDIRQLAEQIGEYRRALNLGMPEGLNKEVRAVMLLDSAEHGTFPDDLSTDDVQTLIKSLRDSLAKRGDAKAQGLVGALSKLYARDKQNPKSFAFKETVKQQATDIIRRKFEEVIGGADPFLTSQEKWEAYKLETGSNGDHPFLKWIDAYNNGVKTDPTTNLKNKLVSFAKLFTVFAGQMVMSVPSVDELQVYFHRFNDQAGDAAGTNIGEFPIDMPAFLEQYREHIERRGSERITLEEFMSLVVQAQIDDTRAVAYGFRQYFEAPFSKADAGTKKGATQQFENALSGFTSKKGPFKKPVVEMYVETTFRSDNGTNVDLLKQFERRATMTGDPQNGARSGDLKRIMRIHVFDKQAHPYKQQAKLLRSDAGNNPGYLEVQNDFVNNGSPDGNKLMALKLISKGAAKDLPLSDLVQGANANGDAPGNISIRFDRGFSNDDVKRVISKTVPTIVYGMNSSTVKDANLASKQDPLLAATQMMGNKAGKPSVTQPNGGGIGGMPLRIVPASMQMHTLGNPLVSFGEIWFVDYNTGTTADNLYGITGITHTLAPGKFETQLTMTYADAYGVYENPPTITDYLKQIQVPEQKGGS